MQTSTRRAIGRSGRGRLGLFVQGMALSGILGVAAYADAPTTSGAASGEPKTAAVMRGNLSLSSRVDGWFAPVEPLEVRFRPKAYAGELRVETAAPHGSVVEAGTVILKLDSADLARQVAAAENELALAQANLAKAQADVALGDQGDELAMRIQRDQLASAQRVAEWWNRVDEPNQLKQYELEVKSANDSVGDQADELEQLRKMYKSEELTNATADIVVKRAVRQYERSKEVAGLIASRTERNRAVEVEEGRRRVADGVAQQQQALAVLESAQAQARVARRTGLFTAQAAYDAAQRKVAELKADLAAMTVAAPAAGVVYYGRLNAGAWQGNEPDALRPGSRVQPEQVVMQVISPGRLTVVAAVPEDEVGRVRPGDPVTVTSKSFPETPLAGKVQVIAPVASMPGDPAKFEVHVTLTDAPDARLAPGHRAAVNIDVADAENVLLIPRGALGDGGRVKLAKSSSADAAEREIITGRTDGKRVEVVRGLSEGETVLADFPSK